LNEKSRSLSLGKNGGQTLPESRRLLPKQSEKAECKMGKEAKYYALLDKLAEAIRQGNHDKIERIKDKIEETEHQIYLEKLKESEKNGKRN
jgi:uncharacterized protein YpuA (DUF1002 family)